MNHIKHSDWLERRRVFCRWASCRVSFLDSAASYATERENQVRTFGAHRGALVKLIPGPHIHLLQWRGWIRQSSKPFKGSFSKALTLWKQRYEKVKWRFIMLYRLPSRKARPMSRILFKRGMKNRCPIQQPTEAPWWRHAYPLWPDNDLSAGRTPAISGFPGRTDNQLGRGDSRGKLGGGNLLESGTDCGSDWNWWPDHSVWTN